MALSVIVPLCVPCDSVSEDPVELALLFKHMTNHPVLKCLKNNKKTCLIYELNTIKNQCLDIGFCLPPPESRYTIYQRWACNNSAKKSFQSTKLLLIALCLYSLWLLHLKTGTLTFTIPVVTITICSYSIDRGTTLARKISPNAKFANNFQICESELTLQ